MKYTTIRVKQEVKDKLEEKKKELELKDVGQVVERLANHLPKLKK